MSVYRADRTAILHRIVEHKGVVYLSGFTADDTSVSPKQQAENILGKIDTYLSKAGTSRSNILVATVYVSDMAFKAEVNEAWKAWIEPSSLPARACVAVGLDGGAAVEIVVTAAK